MLSQILFSTVTITAVALFTINLHKIIRNIRLGRNTDRSDQPWRRLMLMVRVALGQSKNINPLSIIMELRRYAVMEESKHRQVCRR